MKKILVAYFSAGGATARLAKTIADATGGDLFEIKPQLPYAAADLDWTDSRSRSTIEMNDEACRPAIADRVENMMQYDTVFIGFPIWWYQAPCIIETFWKAMILQEKSLFPLPPPAAAAWAKRTAF